MLLAGGLSLAGLTLANLACDRHCLAIDPAPVGNSVDFSVSIEILDSPKDELLDRHLVLFSDGKIYDFAQSDPRDVMVIDPIAGQVTLLSRKQQIQTRIRTQDMVEVVARVRVDAKEAGLERIRGIGVQPQLKDGKYALEFDKYSYQAEVLKPPSANQALQFAEFTDWAARVNLIRELGPPPFARMALGRKMATDGVVPHQITLACKSDQVDRTFKSIHHFSDALVEADRKRIAEVDGMIALYRQVAPNEFPK